VTNAANTSYQEIFGVPMPGRTIIGGVEMVFRKRRADQAMTPNTIRFEDSERLQTLAQP